DPQEPEVQRNEQVDRGALNPRPKKFAMRFLRVRVPRSGVTVRQVLGQLTQPVLQRDRWREAEMVGHGSVARSEFDVFRHAPGARDLRLQTEDAGRRSDQLEDG